MNEQITKLASKHALYVDGGNGKTNYTFTKESMAEFVQLIVEACAQHIENNTDRHRKDYFADLVRQTFGVEL